MPEPGRPDDGPADAPTEAPTGGANFTPAEDAAVRAAVVAGTVPRCPRCDVPMQHKAIGGGSFGLGYRRRREWVLCPSCRRSVLFDRARGTRT